MMLILRRGDTSGGKGYHLLLLSLDAAQDRSSLRRQDTMEPLPVGGCTSGSDEGRLKLQELMTMCTKLSKQVLDLEKEKDVQAVEILRLKKRVKRLERQRKAMQLLKWKLHENCGIHTLFMDGTPMEINMLVEKKYPLIKELLEKMLNLQLEAEEESTMAFELIKFIKSMLEE
ncbi:hypothetical protein Tco_0199835 [Tanacetum coccineum]